MIVTHYPSERARRENKPAGHFHATKWAEAPGGKTWAMIDGLPRSSANTIAVTAYQGQTWFTGQLPEGVTYA